MTLENAWINQTKDQYLCHPDVPDRGLVKYPNLTLAILAAIEMGTSLTMRIRDAKWFLSTGKPERVF